MTPYERDRARSDRFIPLIKEIVGPYLLVETPEEIDCKQAADLMVLTGRDITIACRVRNFCYLEKYRYEFTIRAMRDSGAKTELAKIIDGWAQWLFYAYADLADEHIALWRLIDLNTFRADLVRCQASIRKGDKSNGDGTYFKWFDLRSFPAQPPILIATNDPLPTMMQQPFPRARASALPPVGAQGVLF